MTKELTLNKVAAAFVGVAMVAGLAFAFAAERAHAITLSELVELFIALEVIPADKADEARAVLDGEEETTATPTTPGTPGALACTGSFTRNLTVGDTGADVKTLQMLLNSNGFTVATAGAPGSAGMETMYFGPATKSAVTAMQNAFASEILAPLGLTAGTGYFGASTRAKANALCSGSPSTPPTPPSVPGDDDDDATGDDDDDTLSGGEASLEDFKRLGSPSGETVGEGEEEAEVAGFEFEVKDADARLSRVDVNFEATSGASGYSNKPYEYFESVQLYLDGEMIAEEDASAKGDWSDLAGDVWQMRFSGLSEIVDEDSNPEIVVAVTVKSNLDSEDEATFFDVWVPANGLRAIDGAGVNQYTGSDATDNKRSFSTKAAGDDDELKVSLSSSNPKASIVRVSDTSTTKDVAVLVFEMKAEGNDIVIDEIPVTFTITGHEFDDVVSDIKLDIDGDIFSDYSTVASGTDNTASTTFDIDEDVEIDEDGKVTVKVLLNLKQKTGNYATNPVTIAASVSSTQVDAITGTGGDDLSATTNSGSAIGETHQLQSEGIFAEIISTKATKTAGDNNANDVGDFEVKFDISAFDDTFYVSATSTGVVVYHVEDGAGATVATTTTAALTSTATKEGSAYRINDGGTETFTLTVNLNPDTTGFYRIELDSITYGTTAALPYGLSHTAAPDEDFETDNLNLNA